MEKPPVSHTFTRAERLKSRKVIGTLFQQGGPAQSFLAYPLRVVFVELAAAEPSGVGAQVAFSVSKRAFKKAVVRNRVKRLMREAYRLHKHELYARLGDAHPPVALMLIYVAKEVLPFAEVEAGMRKLVRKWPEKEPPPSEPESGG